MDAEGAGATVDEILVAGPDSLGVETEVFCAGAFTTGALSAGVLTLGELTPGVLGETAADVVFLAGVPVKLTPGTET